MSDDDKNEPQQSSSSITSMSSDEYKNILLQYVTSPQKWRDLVKILILIATLFLTVLSLVGAYLGLSKMDQVNTFTHLLYSLTTTPSPTSLD